MAFAASGFEDDGLPQFSTLDQLHQRWKKRSGPATPAKDTSSASSINTSVAAGSHLIGPTMAAQNGAVPQAIDLEAAPDLELKIRIVYADARVKNMEGSLNPTRTVQQLKTRLATQLQMQPHLVEMSWSKTLNNGQQREPLVLDNGHNLMFYEVETDDIIILRELQEN